MPNGVVIVVAGDDKTGEVFNAVKRHLDETKEKAHETSESLGEMGELLKHGLEAAGIGLGIREIVDQFKEVVSGAAEFGESIAKAGERTGIAAGTLSVLHYAAAVTGTDFDKLVAGAGKLGKNMADAADGNKKAAAAFQAIGVNAKDLVGRADGLDIAFRNLGKTLAETESPARRNQIAMNLLGKAGSASIPVLIELAQGFDEFKKKAQDAGVYLDDMSASKLQQLNQKMLDLQQRVMGAKVSFTEGLTPALEGLLSAFQDATGGTDTWATAGRAAGTAALWMAEAFSYLSAQIKETWEEFQGWSAFIDQSDHGTNAKILKGIGLTSWGNSIQAEADADSKRLQDAIASHKKIVAEDEAFRAKIEALHKKIQNPEAGPKPEKPKGDPNDHGHEAPGKVEKTDSAQNRLEDTRRQLADAVSKVDAARAKSDADTELTILEGLHKQQLISDATYYAQKGAIQRAAFEAEHSAIQAQQIALMDQIDAVEARKPKTAKDRLEQEAQLNTLRKDELDLDAKLLELDGHRAQKAAELDAAHGEALQRQRDQIAQMEAELERAAGGTFAGKGIAEARVKSGEERTKLANGGATPQQLAEFDALEKLKEAKLQIQALDRQGEVIKRTAELAEAKVQQAELAHLISQKDAEQQLNVIRSNELAQLQALSNGYKQYGQAGLDAEARVQQEITQTMQLMEKEGQEINQTVQAFAHSIFDPLFDMGEKWQKKWESISKGLERDLGQLAEKQLFGALFGDEATGGHGKAGGGGGILGGGSGRGGLGGAEGLLGGILGTLFGKKSAGTTSNGGLGGGAGTIPDSAASLLQLGKGGAGVGGGIQVVLNNQGPPMQVDQSSQSTGDGGEGQVIQIMLKQLETNGPIAQGIAALFQN